MKTFGWFHTEYEKAKNSIDFKIDALEMHIIEKILEEMEKQKVNRSELSNKLNVSKAAVSMFLKNGSNMTLKRLLTIANVLNLEVNVDFKPRHQSVYEIKAEYDPKPQAKILTFRANTNRFDNNRIDEVDKYAVNEY
jgi:transcriptional regulator with XRE-family HTH domain